MKEAIDEWLSAAEIARRRRLDRSTTSRRIAKFVEAQILEVREEPGGARRYNLAAFDQASVANVDPARALASSMRQTAKRPAAPAAADDGLEDSVILFGDFANSARDFINAAMRAVDILQDRAGEIAASASTAHARAALDRVHREMRAAVKEAADRASVRPYVLTPKGRRDFGLDG